jgi:hypothetical protein
MFLMKLGCSPSADTTTGRGRGEHGGATYYDEHNLSQQRAYQILYLMVSSDPHKFNGLADKIKLPESRQATCKRDFAKASSGRETVLKPWLRQPGDPETKIDVVCGDGKRKYDAIVNIYRSMRFLETVAANSATTSGPAHSR